MQDKRTLAVADLDDILFSMARSELGKPDDKADDLDDQPVIYFPVDFMLATWQDYRQHGHLPMPGGLMEQDAQWYDSYLWLNRRYNAILRKMMSDKRDGFNDLSNDDNFTDWIDLTRD